MISALRTGLIGCAAACLCAGAILLEPAALVRAREQSVDIVSQLMPVTPSTDVVVVDIDEASEIAIGPWPWPREITARLVQAVADAEPAAIGLDVLFAGRCGLDQPGNAALARAVGSAPVSLSAVIPGPDAAPAPLAAIAVKPPVPLLRLWRSPGMEAPCPEFVAKAAGLSVLSLAGDGAALVRSVPGLAAVGQDMLPGLAVDVVRLREGVGTMVLSGSRDPQIGIGPRHAALDPDGEIRFQASSPDEWARRTVSAQQVMSEPQPLSGKIVLIGASLPQLGTLRPTAASPLAPSTQIMADAVTSMLAGRVPWRPALAPFIEVAALAISAILILLAILRLRPGAAATVIAAIALALMGGAAALFHSHALIIDPLFPALGALMTGLAAGLSQFSATRASEAAIRTSFEQRLPPAVVARLAAGQTVQREERVVTAVFTDIEGFTRLTSAAGPQALVALLDGYVDGITRIVTQHGGMVDKIVGDAVHAFFNMPLRLDEHEAKALACAEAILAFTESYRARPDVARHGFGRTRIGIETGLAVVGDVGAAGKFDYSAHGASVNLAARLQDANKRTGTSILAGPGIRASAPPGWHFQSLGLLDMAGFGPVEVFSPQKTS